MREELAALMHEIWGDWMKYLFSQCWHNFGGTGEKDGSITIPARDVERWMRQMKTPYDELSEKEKDSDRRQADKVLALLKKYFAASGRVGDNDATARPPTVKIADHPGRIRLT